MSGSTEEPDILFRGTDGNECEAFVVAVRDLAFSKGLQKDRDWMLHFATTRLRGKALRWHTRLDPTIREDWDLFVQALFDQSPLVEEPSSDEMATPVWSSTTFSPSLSAITLPANLESNPSSARQSLQGGPVEHCYSLDIACQHTRPVRQYDASHTRQQIGLLRIVSEEGISIPQYIWWGYTLGDINPHQKGPYFSLSQTTTLNRHEALIVSFLPSSAPLQIGCLNSRGGVKTLSILYSGSFDQEYYALWGCSNNTSFIDPAAGRFGFVLNVWSFLEDGTLQASLSSFSQNHTNDQGQYEATRFTTTEVHVDTSGEIIRFVKNGTPLEQDKPQGKAVHPFVRARIVFEPL